MFAKEQPDLNWENPKLRQKLYDMINWWLEKGLSGFRIDAIINIKKDLKFPDFEPDGADGMAGCWKMVESVDGVGELLEDLKKNTFQKYDAFTVGEVFNMKADELPEFIGENGHFSTIFDFSAHCLSDGEHGWYDAPKMEFSKWRKAIFQSQMETQKYGFKANIIENHDEPRGVSRFLPAYAQTPAGTKMLGTVNLLLRGIPFIYQGQEIGMKNAKWNSIDEFDDISTKDQYQIAREAGLSDQEAMEACNRMSRDNARTPMQWTSGENAGFTKGTAWLKINPDYKEINVEDQENNPDSVLICAKMRLLLVKDLRGSSCLHKSGKNFPSSSKSIFYQSIQLSVGKSSRTAFSELHIGIRIQDAVLPEIFYSFLAFICFFSTFQYQWTVSGFCQIPGAE